MLLSIFPLTTILPCVLLCFRDLYTVGAITITFSVFPLPMINGTSFLPNLNSVALTKFSKSQSSKISSCRVFDLILANLILVSFVVVNKKCYLTMLLVL